MLYYPYNMPIFITKRYVLLVIYRGRMPFAAILMANTALTYSNLAVISSAFRYFGHAHVLHRRQGV